MSRAMQGSKFNLGRVYMHSVEVRLARTGPLDVVFREDVAN